MRQYKWSRKKVAAFLLDPSTLFNPKEAKGRERKMSLREIYCKASFIVSDMSRYSSSDYLGSYDLECPQGVFIPSYAPTPTLPPVQPGEPGEPGPPGPPVSIKLSALSTRTF